MMESSPVLRFENLEQYLLLKNGNFLYKVPYQGGFAVLKVYYGSLPMWRYRWKSAGNLLVANQTAVMPWSRRKTELDCIRLWREAGFRVFNVYYDRVEGLPPDGYALFEWVDAPRFVNYFADRTIPIATRLETWRRFLPVWHRRHRFAVERREPRFVHENGDLKHVMIVGDEFLFFDFETCFRSRDRVKEIVAREILCYLKSMARTVHDEFDTFLEETVAHYPGRDLLTYTREFAFADPNPLVRFGRKLDLAFRERAQKSSSKYRIAARLDTMLGRG
ncbi:MAG: hypothetical protein FJ108_03920 [Deltaproteobacteria bacterium]|nr:hypothetical protein [Deltaproteobacteria bacterium]